MVAHGRVNKGPLPSALVKRSVIISGHKTSMCLEPQFWEALEEIVREMKVTLSDALENLDFLREQSNLCSYTRLFVLNYYRDKIKQFGVQIND